MAVEFYDWAEMLLLEDCSCVLQCCQWLSRRFVGQDLPVSPSDCQVIAPTRHPLTLQSTDRQPGSPGHVCFLSGFDISGWQKNQMLKISGLPDTYICALRHTAHDVNA